MKRFDGIYGKLVKDWGLEEWTKFYCEHYVGFVSADGRETDPHMRRMFCGPFFCDNELSKYVDADPESTVGFIDEPLYYLPQEGMPDWRDMSWDEVSAARNEYRKSYPLPPVATHIIERLHKLEAEAIEERFKLPISEDIEGMSRSSARQRIGGNFWCQRKGYSGTVERAKNAREYAYIVARYPELRSENPDEMWAGKEGYTRFYQQYVDYFANLTEADRVRLDKCKRKLGMTNLECHNRVADWYVPKNINYCDTADGCWVENQEAA